MVERITVFCLNKSNIIFKEINIEKPKTYEEFLKKIGCPQDFILFYISNKNEEIIIKNNDDYKLSKNILFIRIKNGQNNKKLENSFLIPYNNLPDSLKDKLEEKYNCSICQEFIKKEDPYFCYSCQKIYHINCLKNWDIKNKKQNLKLSCPNCRNELPLDKWKKKLNYEDNRKDEEKNINQILTLKKSEFLKTREIKELKKSILLLVEFN